MKNYQISPTEVARTLGSDLQNGIDETAVKEKTERYGTNILSGQKSKSFVDDFTAHCKDYTTIVFAVSSLAATLVSLFLQNYYGVIYAVVLLLIGILFAVLFTVFEHYSDTVVQNIHGVLQYTTVVMRGGVRKSVDVCELVPGDIIFLKAGDRVPADARIIQCKDLRVSEFVLTGSKVPADKNEANIAGDNHSVNELSNMLFAESFVMEGMVKAIVTETGDKTKVVSTGKSGSIQSSLSPMQRQMSQLSKLMGLFVLSISALIFVVGIILGNPVADMLLLCGSLVAIVAPGSLTAMATVLLAFGANRLAMHRAIVKDLSVIEKLGTVSVVCSDKTGTLTDNRMRVASCYVDGQTLPFERNNFRTAAELILYAGMCCDARLETQNGKRVCNGDPTEGGILLALEHLGSAKEHIEKNYPRMGGIPFDARRRAKSSIHLIEGRNLVIVKGSPDAILPKCIDDEDVKQKALAAADAFSAASMRVLAIAVKEMEIIPSELYADEIETSLSFVGLIGLADTPRTDSFSALSLCAKADIRPVMMTGDHIITAKSVAQNLGIMRENDVALEGADFARCSYEQLEENIDRCRVLSGLDGVQKEIVVSLWQKRGESVAITGNAVSDVAALELADVGVSLAEDGCDAANASADIVLLDNNFSRLVSSFRRARGVYNNIKKVMLFLSAAVVAELLVLLLSLIFTQQIAIEALSLWWLFVALWLLPALSVGTETARTKLMSHPPRNKKANFFTKRLLTDILRYGALVGVVCFVSYWCATGFSFGKPELAELAVGRSACFVTLGLGGVFCAHSLRSRHPILEVGLFKNKGLLFSSLISLVMLVLVMFVPPVRGLFGFAKLGFGNWVFALVFALLPTVFFEITKYLKKR